ncbi:LPXTG cell wall anchor domain-containing protein [Vaginisenegalia massiliensis]|uniref:LPXTG cell wall anchor domain-containing protein n=1 Tax=Vaginisenegalia massiliensis TaxID=2058294 RepID=UPI000F52EE66|nr:LPXTG cell wall anchor domain-containing protein [Vaginisenegalia massiliensis]
MKTKFWLSATSILLISNLSTAIISTPSLANTNPFQMNQAFAQSSLPTNLNGTWHTADQAHTLIIDGSTLTMGGHDYVITDVTSSSTATNKTKYTISWDVNAFKAAYPDMAVEGPQAIVLEFDASTGQLSDSQYTYTNPNIAPTTTTEATTSVTTTQEAPTTQVETTSQEVTTIVETSEPTTTVEATTSQETTTVKETTTQVESTTAKETTTTAKESTTTTTAPVKHVNLPQVLNGAWVTKDGKNTIKINGSSLTYGGKTYLITQFNETKDQNGQITYTINWDEADYLKQYKPNPNDFHPQPFIFTYNAKNDQLSDGALSYQRAGKQGQTPVTSETTTQAAKKSVEKTTTTQTANKALHKKPVKALPSTGEKATPIVMIGAILLIIGGIILVMKNRKK